MKIGITIILTLISSFCNAQAITEETILYSYDDLNRLIHVVWEDEVEKMYVYDDVGNRIQLQNTGTLGIEDEVLKNALTVYPNPTDGWITVQLPQEEDFADPEISVYSMQGLLLGNRYPTMEDHSLKLSLAGLPTGVYLIRLKEKDRIWSQLVIKK